MLVAVMVPAKVSISLPLPCASRCVASGWGRRPRSRLPMSALTRYLFVLSRRSPTAVRSIVTRLSDDSMWAVNSPCCRAPLMVASPSGRPFTMLWVRWPSTSAFMRCASDSPRWRAVRSVPWVLMSNPLRVIQSVPSISSPMPGLLASRVKLCPWAVCFSVASTSNRPGVLCIVKLTAAASRQPPCRLATRSTCPSVPIVCFSFSGNFSHCNQLSTSSRLV